MLKNKTNTIKLLKQSLIKSFTLVCITLLLQIIINFKQFKELQIITPIIYFIWIFLIDFLTIKYLIKNFININSIIIYILSLFFLIEFPKELMGLIIIALIFTIVTMFSSAINKISNLDILEYFIAYIILIITKVQLDFGKKIISNKLIYAIIGLGLIIIIYKINKLKKIKKINNLIDLK